MFCQICSFLFFCSCVDINYQKPVYSYKDLQEIVIYDAYLLEDKKEIKEFKRNFTIAINNFCDTRYERCTTQGYCDLFYEQCKDRLDGSETPEEVMKERLRYRVKEGFEFSSIAYCYDYTKTENKIPGFTKKDLRVRLYSKEGKLLSEGFPTLWRRNDYVYRVRVYLPYHEEGHKISVIQSEEEKETVVYETRMRSQSNLKEISDFFQEIASPRPY